MGSNISFKANYSMYLCWPQIAFPQTIHFFPPSSISLLAFLQSCFYWYLFFIVTGGDRKPGKLVSTGFCFTPLVLEATDSFSTAESCWNGRPRCCLLFLKYIDCQCLWEPLDASGNSAVPTEKVFISLMTKCFPLKKYWKITATGYCSQERQLSF